MPDLVFMIFLFLHLNFSSFCFHWILDFTIFLKIVLTQNKNEYCLSCHVDFERKYSQFIHVLSFVFFTDNGCSAKNMQQILTSISRQCKDCKVQYQMWKFQFNMFVFETCKNSGNEVIEMVFVKANQYKPASLPILNCYFTYLWNFETKAR